MKLICWNVNGIRAAYKNGLKEFLAVEQPDIFCVQETKAQPDQLEEEQANPDSYTGYFSSAKKKGYSGVASFFKGNFKPASVESGIGLDVFDSEGRFLITELPGGITLYNIYFPSGTTGDHRQDFKYKFLDALTEHLCGLSKAKRDNLIICGDFNICHRDIDIHHPKEATKKQFSGFLPEERAWVDEFVKLGFVDCFRHVNGDQLHKYTWWSFRANSRAKNLGWRIDYFFVSKELAARIKDAQILDSVRGSDHCPITLVL